MFDSVGNTLYEGDQVVVPIGFGQFALAQVVHISSGLVNPNAPNQPAVPVLTVQINWQIPALPNGAAPGVVRLPNQPVPEAKPPEGGIIT
jgi:hypothetical protein